MATTLKQFNDATNIITELNVIINSLGGDPIPLDRFNDDTDVIRAICALALVVGNGAGGGDPLQARNGLSVVDGFAEMGGEITKDTTITGTNRSFNFNVREFKSFIEEDVFGTQAKSELLIRGVLGNSISSSNFDESIESKMTMNQNNVQFFHSRGTSQTRVSLTEAGILIKDDNANKGLTGTDLFSVSGEDEQYVQFGNLNYRDAKNGLNLDRNDIKLGGILTEDTTISGNFRMTFSDMDRFSVSSSNRSEMESDGVLQLKAGADRDFESEIQMIDDSFIMISNTDDGTNIFEEVVELDAGRFFCEIISDNFINGFEILDDGTNSSFTINAEQELSIIQGFNSFLFSNGTMSISSSATNKGLTSSNLFNISGDQNQFVQFGNLSYRNANNGLILLENDIKLGGKLTQLETVIFGAEDLAGQFGNQRPSLRIGGESTVNNPSTGRLSFFEVSSNAFRIGAESNGTNRSEITASPTGNVFRYIQNLTNDEVSINLKDDFSGGAKMEVKDQLNQVGLQYSDDYYVNGIQIDRWIPDIASIKRYLLESGGNTPRWAFYEDDQFTTSNRFNVPGTGYVNLPNNANTVTNTAMVTGNEFYDGTLLTPDEINDTYEIRITFTARSSTQNNWIKLAIEIGGSIGVFNDKYQSVRSSNQDHPMNVTLKFFVGSTFIANGGVVKIDSLNSIDIWDIKYFIEKNQR